MKPPLHPLQFILAPLGFKRSLQLEKLEERLVPEGEGLLSIGDLIFNDINNNGLFDDGEQGVENVEVRLYDDTNNLLGTTFSDEDGFYDFTFIGEEEVLEEGDYRIEIVLPAGFASSTGIFGQRTGPFEGPTTPDPDTDNDDDDNGSTLADNPQLVSTALVTLVNCEEPDLDEDPFTNETVDFGIFQPMSLGNRVFNDANNDGKFSAGETGIANVKLNLYRDADGDGQPDEMNPLLSTFSDANGFYLFELLTPNNYVIEVLTPAGFVSSSGTNGSATGLFEGQPLDANNDLDDVDDGNAVGGSVFSGTIKLELGTEPVDEATSTPNLDTLAADNNSNRTIDFGFYQPLSVGNLIFNDINNSGTLDAGETGVADINVRLLNAAGATLLTTKTDGTGNYLFSNLIAGSYQIEIDLPAAFLSSTGTVGSSNGPFEGAATPDPDTNVNEDDNGNTVAGTANVRTALFDLNVGAEPTTDGDGANGNLTVDFGIFRPMSLGNKVWHDLNNNGQIDAGEPGIANLKVALFADTNDDVIPDGAALAETTTDANGYYLFTHLVPGNYLVQVTDPTGSFTSSTGTNGSVTGPFEPAPDPDNNQDDDDNSITVVGQAGVFRSGTITLALDNEPSREADVGPQIDNATDNNSNLTVDFGLLQPLLIGNRVFDDANNNGKLDVGEMGRADVTIRLFLDANGDGIPDGAALATTKSDAQGYYLFTNLNDGKYLVEADRPAGFLSSTGTNLSTTGPVEGTDLADPNNDIDGDDSGNTVGLVVRSRTIQLTRGGEPRNEMDRLTAVDMITDGNENLTVDFGFYQPLQLGNLVFLDNNNNGRFDATETGLAKITVQLLDANDVELANTTTDDAGKYWFTNLAAGNYRVAIVLPTGASSSVGVTGAVAGPFEPAPDANDNVNNDDNGTASNLAPTLVRSSLVTLQAGTEPIDDGDDDANTNLSVDFGVVNAGSIVHRIFTDANGNGLFDEGEAKVAGAKVLLLDANRVPLMTATTDLDGTVRFTGLQPGTYQISYDTTTLPPAIGYATPSNQL